MGKKASDLVRESNDRSGRVRKSVNLTPERLAQMERLVEDYGSIIAVVHAGMDALERRNESPADLAERLAKMLRG